ncbi:hypothetical protein V2G26_004962 [Clonostachys chloroleuca]
MSHLPLSPGLTLTLKCTQPMIRHLHERVQLPLCLSPVPIMHASLISTIPQQCSFKQTRQFAECTIALLGSILRPTITSRWML